MPKRLSGTIVFRLSFRVGSREKALKEFERAEDLFARKLSMTGCERYWKIPELWNCDVTVDIEAASVDELVTTPLLLANRLATGWYVLGPYLSGDGNLESFEGIFSKGHSKPNLQSLEWAHFSLGRPVARA